MNGTAPSALIAVHITPTIRNPSRLRTLMCLRRNGAQNKRPASRATLPAAANRLDSPSA